jgi:hypothetical protein
MMYSDRRVWKWRPQADLILQKERKGSLRCTWGYMLRQGPTALIHPVYEPVKFDRSPEYRNGLLHAVGRAKAREAWFHPLCPA